MLERRSGQENRGTDNTNKVTRTVGHGKRLGLNGISSGGRQTQRSSEKKTK